MSEMTPERLAEIKARCEAADPPPWKLWMEGPYIFLDLGGHGDIPLGVEGAPGNNETANFIVATRQDVPDLVAEIERLRRRDD